MLEFTKALYELFVIQKLSLSQSLLIMRSKPKRDSVSRAAFSLYEQPQVLYMVLYSFLQVHR